MSQSKRTKGRGSGGFNRPRNRGQNSPHSHTSINSQNDDLKQPSVDIYQNSYLVHSIISLLGCSVEVTVPNGAVYEGVLKTVSQTLDVTLEMAHKVQKKSGQQKIEEYTLVPSKECVIETLVIGLKNIVCITAKDVDLDEIKKADNFTDTAISSRLNGQAGHERQLQKWEDPSGEHEHEVITGMLEDSSMLNVSSVKVFDLSNDGIEVMGQQIAQLVPSGAEEEVQAEKNGLDPDEMFATNKEKYGVTSSYDHNMLCYTTPVEGSKELEDRAEILAREIEQENTHSDRSEVDSGKTEEELFSAVVRASPAQGKPKAQVANSREENKRDGVPSKDLPTVSPPKPQRVPQRERERLPDNTTKPTAVIEQVKSTSRDAVNSIPAEHESRTDGPSVKPVPKPKVVSSAAESGITILDVKQPKGKTPREDTKERQTENVKEKLEELKSFSSNFKLAGTEEANTEHLKKETPATGAQQPTPKEQTPSSTGEEEPPQQRDSPKVQEQQRNTETPPKTTEKEKSSKLNPNAKEFRPSQPVMQRTSPVTPQQQYIPTVPSPTSGRPPYHLGGQVMRPMHQMNKQPRPPYNPGQRFFSHDPSSDPHGSPGMSAATAAGNPIYTQPFPHQFLAVQGQPFHAGMLQQNGPFMLRAGPQGTPSHYMVPHSVANASGQSVAPSFQENTPVQLYTGPLPMSPSSPFPGSPQPSPTTQGQLLQYIPQPVMPQQQSNQPTLHQAVMTGTSQHPMLMMQQGGPQPITMTGIPGSGPPGSPMMQFMQGPVGYPASRKSQPQQWPHQQHP